MAGHDNLYQRNGVWWGRVQVNGQDVRKSLRTRNRPIAKTRLKALLDEAARKRVGEAEPAPIEAPKTWGDAVARWRQAHQSDLKPTSLERYEVSFRQLSLFFGGRLVSTITPKDVAEYALKRMEGRASGSTVRRDLSAMSRVMRVAKRAGWVEQNPVPEEKAEIRENRVMIRPVPTRDIVAVIRAARRSSPSGSLPGMAELIAFLARVGCRQEEGASLEWSQISLTKRSVTFMKTKTDAPRVITLTPRTAAWIAGFQRGQADADGHHYVFRDASGGRLKFVSRRFERARRHAKVPHFRCHDLRHTYAIRRLQADERKRDDDQPRGIFPLALHLGHSSTRTTEIYVKFLLRPSY